MPEEIIYELTGGAVLSGETAQPNIIVTRNEAGMKEGYVGIDTDGGVRIKMRLYQDVIVETIDSGSGLPVAVNWALGNKYDVTISDLQSFILRSCFNGQEVTMVFNNTDTDIALLFFTAEDGEVIKWLGGDMPYVNPESNAIITFYKSNEIIYAEIKRDYVDSVGSDS